MDLFTLVQLKFFKCNEQSLLHCRNQFMFIKLTVNQNKELHFVYHDSSTLHKQWVLLSYLHNKINRVEHRQSTKSCLQKCLTWAQIIHRSSKQNTNKQTNTKHNTVRLERPYQPAVWLGRWTCSVAIYIHT